jgi:tetratricopeptide (TPR) repeat protein
MLLDRRRVKFWQRIVFGSLAAIFAISFVIGGVGSGTNFSVSDIFNSGGSSGGSTNVPSDVSKTLKQTQLHPKDAAVWAAYGQALQGNNQLAPAIAAYVKATKLAPNNLEYRNTLATYYSSQGATAAQQAQTLQYELYTQSQGQSSSEPFNGVPGSTLGSALQSAVSQAQTQTLNSQSAAVQAKYSVLAGQAQSAYANALGQYKYVTGKQPKDPSGWYNYGLTARQAGQNATAIAAFKQFLKIAPDAPESPGVKAVIKQLQPAKAAKSSSSSSTTTTG